MTLQPGRGRQQRRDVLDGDQPAHEADELVVRVDIELVPQPVGSGGALEAVELESEGNGLDGTPRVEPLRLELLRDRGTHGDDDVGPAREQSFDDAIQSGARRAEVSREHGPVEGVHGRWGPRQ